MGWLQVLEHQLALTDPLLKPMGDGEAIVCWDVPQETADPKSTLPDKRVVLKGTPTMSDSYMLGRLIVHGEQSNH